MAVVNIQQAIKESQLDENKRRELSTAIHAHFKEWLYATGNIKQLYFLQAD
ncbi:hypothetical protein ZOSMA_16G01490 [Zostera marina]|uniref:Uncharacterized protein n=1 Tax=Zostera marina TaxID=29655 RepID=A0A0K9PT14_ZOSMR|nr:hypothetical protein ZOSMA_16G01490 [Zostera marina]